MAGADVQITDSAQHPAGETPAPQQAAHKSGAALTIRVRLQ